MDGRWSRLRERVRALLPAVQARVLEDGGLRSVLVLLFALVQGARAETLVEAVVPVAALALGVLSLALPDPVTEWGRARSFVLQRLSERGTFRSLALLVFGLGHGVGAEGLAEHAEAVGMVVLGALSASRPGKAP